MCGIFGMTIKENSGFTSDMCKSTVNNLFKLCGLVYCYGH